MMDKMLIIRMIGLNFSFIIKDFPNSLSQYWFLTFNYKIKEQLIQVKTHFSQVIQTLGKNQHMIIVLHL